MDVLQLKTRLTHDLPSNLQLLSYVFIILVHKFHLFT